MTQIVERIHVHEHIILDKRLGRHIEHDPRSKEHRAVVRPAGLADLHEVHHRRYGVLTQNIGSCTGNAVVGAANTLPFHAKKERVYTEADAVRIYSRATVLDGFPGSYPPEDTGSSGLAAAQAAREEGLINAYKWAFGVEEALTALQTNPVITGTDWYEGFDQPDSHGFVNIAGQSRGGHEYEGVGFIPRATLDDSIVIFVNSWSLAWGVKGRFYMRVRTWRQLLEAQGDVTVLS